MLQEWIIHPALGPAAAPRSLVGAWHDTGEQPLGQTTAGSRPVDLADIFSGSQPAGRVEHAQDLASARAEQSTVLLGPRTGALQGLTPATPVSPQVAGGAQPRRSGSRGVLASAVQLDLARDEQPRRGQRASMPPQASQQPRLVPGMNAVKRTTSAAGGTTVKTGGKKRNGDGATFARAGDAEPFSGVRATDHWCAWDILPSPKLSVDGEVWVCAPASRPPLVRGGAQIPAMPADAVGSSVRDALRAASRSASSCAKSDASQANHLSRPSVPCRVDPTTGKKIRRGCFNCGMLKTPQARALDAQNQSGVSLPHFLRCPVNTATSTSHTPFALSARSGGRDPWGLRPCAMPAASATGPGSSRRRLQQPPQPVNQLPSSEALPALLRPPPRLLQSALSAAVGHLEELWARRPACPRRSQEAATQRRLFQLPWRRFKVGAEEAC